MLRALRSLLVAACAARCLAPPAARAAEPVDLLLVLASDVSRSVDQPKFQLQREGYAAAIADKRVLEAITAGRHRRIAVAFVEWSGVSSQKVVIDWTVIDGADAARKFGDQLVELPRSFAERTSISGGIDFSMGVLARAPYQAAAPHHRRVGRRHQQFRPRRHARPRRGRRRRASPSTAW